MSFQYAQCNRECDVCDAQLTCALPAAQSYREECAEVENLVREQHPSLTPRHESSINHEDRLLALEEEVCSLRDEFDRVIAFFNRMAQGLD